jgi:hypothetical protein
MKRVASLLITKKLFFTPLAVTDSWNRCEAAAEALGLAPKARTPHQRLEFDLTEPRPGLYWLWVVLGLLFYVLPGLYVIWRYRQRLVTVTFTPCAGGTMVAGSASVRDALSLFDLLATALPDKGSTFNVFHKAVS